MTAQVEWKSLESLIEEFLEDYELYGEDEEGRDACYIPTESDCYMIFDAVMGMLSDPEIVEKLKEVLTDEK